MRQTILRLAATPNGFAIADAGNGSKIAENATRAMVANGELHKAKTKGIVTRFFLQPDTALAFMTANVARPREKKSRFTPHPTSLVLSDPPALMAKAPVPPKIKQPVEIIYPERYLKISRPWVDPRAVIVPMRRIGQPGFSMSI